MTTPRVILGTMTFGGGTSQEAATSMLIDFCTNWTPLVRDDPQIDTAIMYQDGKTEVIIGNILQQKTNRDKLPATLSIASKANPFTSDKNLSPSGVRQQLTDSLSSLQTDSVDLYYLHAPDVRHPIEPTLEEIQVLYKEKKFRKLGLSNYTAWETVYIHNYMSTRGYVVPTVYEGMYNALTRSVEDELFPALRKCGMAFYAYNPLAGGMLAGMYAPAATDEEAAAANTKVGDRFSGDGLWAKKYRERYQQREQFAALEVVKKALPADGSVDMAQAALRWLVHHSKLTEMDGIIVGASKMHHLVANMKSLSAGPLEGELVQAFEEAAKLCEHVCPGYSRGWSGSQA